MASTYVPYEKSPARFSANSMNDISETTRNAYLNGTSPRQYATDGGRGGKWNPMNWALWKRLALAAVVVVVIVAIIVGAVVGSRASRYPSYSKLNYSPKDDFSGSGFFNNFDYFNDYDPTQGFVHYDPQPAAQQKNLTFASDTQAIIKVDNTEQGATTGRHSVRITSKNQYDSGLFIFDVAHSPYGCGTWPSIWLVDPSNWPYHGEIDVLEAVNKGDTGNQMTLHTSDGCTMQGVKREETGTVVGESCVNSTDENAGCAVKGAANTYGPGFNSNGGGVYAMELRNDGIRTWFWPRSGIPQDVQAAKSPDPSSWGTALADFPNTNCDIGSHFKNMSIVVDIDLCGSWAGNPTVFNQQSGCSGSCTDLVANQPSAFDDAYWTINSFKVYSAS